METAKYKVILRKLETGETFNVQAYDDVVLLYVDAGRCEIIVEDRRYLLQMGDYLLLGVRERAQVQGKDSGDICVARFALAAVRALSKTLEVPFFRDNLAGRRYFSGRTKNSPMIRVLLGRLMEAGRPAFADDVFRDAVITFIFVYVGRAWEESEQEQEGHKTARRMSFDMLSNYIEENLSGDLSLDALSRVFYFDKYYLAHQFKARTGTTPQRYILQRRMEVARKLLLAGESVRQSAQRCGFSGASYFIKVFSATYGMTPARYVRTQRKAGPEGGGESR